MDVIDAIGNTPLIELKKVCKGLPNRVFVKCEHMNPGGSIKDRTARAIILDAEARGVLVPHQDPPMTIIEGTAGNTGMGLALVASTIVPPGLSVPSFSAASMIGSPMRSLREPPGLKNSAFAYTGVRTPRVTRDRRIIGVQPMVSRTLSYSFSFLMT
jgi:hypothetical protein